MPYSRTAPGARLAPVVGGVFLAGAATLDFLGGVQLSGTYATGAVLACVSARPRHTAAVAAVAVALAVSSGFWHGNVGEAAWNVRLASCVVAGGTAVLAAWLMQRYQRLLQHTTDLAQAVLDALAVELTGARTAKQVADGFAGQAAQRLGATSAMIFVLDPDGVLRSVSWLGRGGPQADAYTELSLDADLPGAVAARTKTPRHYPNLAAIEADYPMLRGYYPQERSLHVLPLVDDGQTIGLLALTFPPDKISTSEERRLLTSLATALSGALVRARNLEATDAEAQRTSLLAEASLSLSRTLDPDSTLAEVCRLLVPRLADWCSVHLLVDGRLETAVVHHFDPETTEWAKGMLDVFPVDMDAPTGSAAVVRTGEPELYPYIPAELLDQAAVNEEHAALLHRLGMVSAVIAPLVGREGTIGAISLAQAESGRRYAAEDLAFLQDLAARIATALETATSFRRQSERLSDVMAVAEAVQLAILAPPPPRVGPVALSARYVSAAQEAQVGGDLYEVVPGPGRVRLLVGDVRGKGLAAVRTATVVLGEFRANAAQDLDIAALASRLDSQLMPYLGSEEDFVTACLVDIDPDGGFSAVTCGHPAPVRLAHGTWQELDLEPAPPLGLGVQPLPMTGQLGPGDRLLLYTDGAIEMRTPDGGFQSPDPLWELAARTPFDETLDAILDDIRGEASAGALRDDLALLLAGYDPPMVPGPETPSG